MVKILDLLEKMKRTPIDLRVLEKKLPPGCKAVQYKDLEGKHRSEAFGENDVLVVLIPKKGSKIGHFIALLGRDRYIEYFSSLGGSPDSELDKLGEPHKIMKNILGNNFIYNSKPLQKGVYNINDCAIWILCRTYLKHLKLREFQNLFDSSVHLQSSDDIAALMCVLLLSDL